MQMGSKDGSPASVSILSLTMSPSSCTVHHAKKGVIHPSPRGHPHCHPPLHWLPKPKNHRITEWLRLEGTLKAIQFQWQGEGTGCLSLHLESLPLCLDELQNWSTGNALSSHIRWRVRWEQPNSANNRNAPQAQSEVNTASTKYTAVKSQGLKSATH